MSNLEATRTQILQESDPLGNKRRFGLFSQPISTAVGDDGAFKTKIHPRNEMGKPVTLPRNVYVSPIKSGQLRKSYFGPLNSLAAHTKHDLFLEEGIRLLQQQNRSFQLDRKQANFFPPNGINKTVVTPAYPYIDQKNPELDPRRFRQEDGRVKSGLRNFYTNNSQKVNATVFKHYKHIDDPFERQHDQQLERLKQEKAKEREEIFKPNSFSPKVLNKDSKIYGSDVQLPPSSTNREDYGSVKHESAWRPNNGAKEGRQGLFTSVHEYHESPVAVRKPMKGVSEEKEAFKLMSPGVLSTPTPSISLNRVNMRQSINRSLSPKR